MCVGWLGYTTMDHIVSSSLLSTCHISLTEAATAPVWPWADISFPISLPITVFSFSKDGQGMYFLDKLLSNCFSRIFYLRKILMGVSF